MLKVFRDEFSLGRNCGQFVTYLNLTNKYKKYETVILVLIHRKSLHLLCYTVFFTTVMKKVITTLSSHHSDIQEMRNLNVEVHFPHNVYSDRSVSLV